jgi:predicted lipid-binding transport protein (Tim44 family)
MFGIIFFIALTFYLLVKLNEILGTRAGFFVEKERFRDFSKKSNVQDAVVSEKNDKVSEMKKIYPSFNSEDFLDKAQKAFQIIFEAYSSGNTRALKELLAPRIFHAFSMAIEDRKKRKEILEGIFVRFISSEITETSFEEDTVLITVRFETEQSNVLKSEDGTILEGNADFVEKRTEVWVFGRKKKSNDSRWYLYEIKSD